METVIIGAGMSGLSTAYHLEKSGRKDYVLLELSSEIGGLCKTIRKDGFTFDFAPHLFFFGDDYATQLVKDLLGDELVVRKRKNGIILNGKITPYPFQYNLYHLNEETRIQYLNEVIEAAEKFKGQTPNSFWGWVKMTLGESIAKDFMGPYNKKCYCVNPEELTLNHLGRYVPRPNLKEIIKGAKEDMSNLEVGYNYQFGYPKRVGIDCIPKAMASKINNIKLKEVVIKIDLNKRIIFTKNTHYPFVNLVSTIPLTKLVELIEDVPSEVELAANKLRCNTVCAVLLGINKPKVSEYQILYLPQKDVLPYRLSFPTNYSERVAPKNMCSICAEYSYLGNKKFTDEEIIEKTIQDLIKLGFIKKKEEVIFKDILELKHAYVIFDSERDKNLKLIQDYLKKNQIYSIGPFGAWEHSSIDDSLILGKEIAKKLLTLP